jgi:hypothetical protein
MAANALPTTGAQTNAIGTMKAELEATITPPSRADKLMRITATVWLQNSFLKRVMSETGFRFRNVGTTRGARIYQETSGSLRGPPDCHSLKMHARPKLVDILYRLAILRQEQRRRRELRDSREGQPTTAAFKKAASKQH